jgi:hypothetical protein
MNWRMETAGLLPIKTCLLALPGQAGGVENLLLEGRLRLSGRFARSLSGLSG